MYSNVSAPDTNLNVSRNNTVFTDVAANLSGAGPVKPVSLPTYQAIPNITQNITGNTDAKVTVPDITPGAKLPVDRKKADNLKGYQGTLTTITVGTGGSNQRYPSIYGDNLVWLDGRNGEQAVYMYNFNTCQEKIICNTSPNGPVIYGNLIGYGVQDSYYGTYGVNIFDISTGIESQITPSDGFNRLDPAIFGDRIVYVDDSRGVRNIVLYNHTTNQTRFLTNDTSGPDHLYPAIYGEWAAWYVGTDDDSVLEVCNIFTGNRTILESTCKGVTRTPPSIYGDRVVWQDWRGGQSDIYMYNSSTRQETLITPGTGDSDQGHPCIFGNIITWDDNRDQSYGIENIFIYDLTTNLSSSITCTDPPVHRVNTKIYGDRIVWENRNDLDYDIVLFTIGPTQVSVVSGFSVNATQGMVPFSVQFNDKSSGNPSTRLWDFGDGNGSYEVNPVYTYLEAGHFSPSLIVSTPYSRDYSVKENLITAGAVPVTKFSISPSSGPAPLTSTFTDLSLGYPDTWNWDFGDNSSSNEQNPTHFYPNPGNYRISLTTGNQFGNNTAISQVHLISSTVNVSSYSIPGVLEYSPDAGLIEIYTKNETAYSYSIGGNNSQLLVIPKTKGALPSFTLISKENTTFSLLNSIISGEVSKIITTSEDISSPEFSDMIGPNSMVNYSFVTPQYFPDGSIKTVISNEITPEQHESFNISVQYADYGDYVSGIAYSVQCIENNMSVSGPATIVMGVRHKWVVKNSNYVDVQDRFKVEQMNPDGSFKSLTTIFSFKNATDNRDYYTVTSADGIDLDRLYIPVVGNHTVSDGRINLISPSGPIYANPTTIALGIDSDWVSNNNLGGMASVYDPVEIIRVDDLGTIEVLKTQFLYYDETRDLDVFSGLSPNGLSQFTLTTVGHYTNPLQMLYLSLSIRVTPPAPASNPNSGGGGGGGGGSYGGSGNQVTQVASEPASTKGSQSGTIQEGTSGTSSSNNMEPNSLSTESVAAGQPSANPVPRVSNAPAANPPVLPPQPTNSIFTIVIEAAAIVSISVLVVFSVYTRNRRRD
ncbi:MAG: PKD domain-containing protein [Methanomicrobiales archaeon]